MFKRSHIRSCASLLAVALLSSSCSNSPTTSTNTTGGGSEVQATASLAFTPSTITIAVGGTVTWVFGSVGHNVTFDAVAGVPTSIAGANANTSIGRTFASAGTYTYHCSIHPSMTGAVVVGSSNVTPPPPPPPEPPPPGYVRSGAH